MENKGAKAHHSYAGRVKQELMGGKLRGKEARCAQLIGLTHAAGTLRLGRALCVDYTTELHEVGLHIASLATGLYELDAQIAVRSIAHRPLTLTTVMLAGEGVETLLADAGLFRRTSEGIALLQQAPDIISSSNACKKAFLRGAFLGAGSISNPRRAYHLEIVCNGMWLAEFLCMLMETADIPAKMVLRKQRFVVYLKEGDLIAAFLAYIGAPVATMAFEDARAERELRNYINRTSNCETANIGKTVNAAGDQIDAIEAVRARQGLETLTPVLRETAELRLNYPDASLQELAALAGIGKSGMNNRLQRLMRIAEELR